MSAFSITQAKAHFAQLVQQAETGQPVRITRRGKSVAVMLSDAEFARLSAARRQTESLFDFTKRMRQQAADAGLSLIEEAELQGLRDQTGRVGPGIGP